MTKQPRSGEKQKRKIIQPFLPGLMEEVFYAIVSKDYELFLEEEENEQIQTRGNVSAQA